MDSADAAGPPHGIGKFSRSQKNRTVAEQLARQLAKQFDDGDYASLDALRDKVSLKSSAKQTHSLLETALIAIRRVGGGISRCNWIGFMLRRVYITIHQSAVTPIPPLTHGRRKTSWQAKVKKSS